MKEEQKTNFSFFISLFCRDGDGKKSHRTPSTFFCDILYESTTEWYFLYFKEVTTKGSEDDVDLVKWFRVIVMQTEHIVMGVFNCYFLIYDSINNRNYIDAARLISKIECVWFNNKRRRRILGVGCGWRRISLCNLYVNVKVKKILINYLEFIKKIILQM